MSSGKTETPDVLPTPEQMAWADAQVGVIIHMDMPVFEPGYDYKLQWGYTPDAQCFNPEQLDTDQWVETAKAAGATYVVLVAKHCSGFTLWPTAAHDYHVGRSPWRGGQGDVVADFFASCAKYDVRPGLYYSVVTNAYCRVNMPGKVLPDDPEFLRRYSAALDKQGTRNKVWAGPEEQARYRRIVEQQLTELWGNYGEVFEIWFDGGLLPPEEGGPDLLPLLKRFQPHAVLYQGPEAWPSRIRFVGNERGEAPDPCWSTTGNVGRFDGTFEVAGRGGHPEGDQWVPAECAMPNRDQHKALSGGWFWREGDDGFLYPVEHLVDRYCTSVGRNTNLLLGMAIDNRGLVPEADCRQFRALGKSLCDMFSDCVQTVGGEGECLELAIPDARPVNMVVLQERLEGGERVRKYVVEANVNDEWQPLFRGTGIGHKRIERFNAVTASALRLRIEESAGTPLIRELSAWHADPALFATPMDPARRNPPAVWRDREGRVCMSCANPGLDIRYTLDGSEPDASSPVYEDPVPLRDGGEVKAVSCIGSAARSATVTAIFGVDRSDWSVVSTSLNSPFSNRGKADVSHLLNDDPDTYWQTLHTDRSQGKPPQEVVLDMQRPIAVEAVTLMGKDNLRKAFPDDVEFFLSDDGSAWTPVARARFSNLPRDPGMQLVRLETPATGRFLRMVVHHVAEDADFVLLAGLGVVEKQA